MLAVPTVVRNKARAVGADAWLSALPDLVAAICAEWEIVVGETYDDATEAYVAAATLADGTPAVLKLIVPRDDAAAAHEATVLRLANGDGCALLLRADVERGALLLERLGTPLAHLDWPLTARHEALCAAAARMWRPAPDADLPTGAEKGRWLVDFITTTWQELDRPCSERAVAHAVDCAGTRIAAHDDERAFLVHGDVHQWNALQSDAGFKLVDPDGLRCEREYDLGILMREDPLELMDGDDRPRAAWLAARTGLDAQAVREWGVVERVSTGLLATKVDLQPAGRDMLRAADAIARVQDR